MHSAAVESLSELHKNAETTPGSKHHT